MPRHSIYVCVRWGVFLSAIALAACGGGGGTTVPDAPPPLSSTFKVHYHRALGDYTGWTVQTTAGAMETTAAAGTPDGFGAVYSLTLTSGATSLAFSIKNGATTDGAGALSVDVSGSTREAWVISGWAEAITRALPALPSASQVAVYYLRADTSYSGWGLHLWGDQVNNTVWGAPLQPAGTDTELGLGFLIDIKTGAAPGNCKPGNICLIVHKGDTKDPGPDMTFDPKLLGNIVFLLTGSADITSVPRRVGDVGIAGVGAHLVAHDTLAWCLGRDMNGFCVGDATLTSAELRYSPTAGITASGKVISGGTVIALTPRPSGLTPAQLLLAPYLAGASVYDIAPADQPALADAIKGQMVAVARKANGDAGKATQVNTALYLDENYDYEGPLGVAFAAGAPTVRVWAPTAQSMKLHVFDGGMTEIAGSPFVMTAGAKGLWEHAGDASWAGDYYRFQLSVYHPVTGKIEDLTVTDPYSVNLSPNGLYSQIVDLNDAALKPPGWDAMVKPPLAAPEDIVVYESHIRDFSVSDATTPVDRRGKYLGFVTEASATQSNGLKHLQALAAAGLTHVHVLPAFDFATVDEVAANRVDIDQPFSALCAKNSAVPAALCGQFTTQTIRQAMATFAGDSDQQQAIAGYVRGLDSFNWGYDPFHYGAPEGSYASTADGTTKILEFRRMVQGINAVGLRTVMDVVYNHTNASGIAEKSVLDKLVPNYYHRLDPDTGFVLSSSCCANTASEHRMMERLIIDTVVQWARAYKIDGFRFDLMGLHMKSNMLNVQAALAGLTPATDGVDGTKIYVYGEGWDMGELASNARGVNANQANMAGTGIGTFNDRLRDGIRGGGPFDHGADLRINQGFASGLYYDPNELSSATATTKDKLANAADLIKIGMAGSLLDFKLVNSAGSTVKAGAIGYGGQGAGYTQDPQESINYSAAHDNQDLWDIVQYKMPTGSTTADRVRAHNISLDVVLLGQGVPFIHMGDDMLRSKSMDGNSYDSGDWFNLVDWSGQTTAWKTGLPQQGDNGSSWNAIRAIYMDATAKPGPANIAAAAAHFQEMLRIRFSSPLFRLRTKADVLTRVDFLNTGPSQVPGVIVMTIADGTCAGADLDPARDGIVVVVNADKASHTMAVPGADGATLHAVQQASADAVVKTSSVAGNQLTVPARTTAVFDVPQSGNRGGGPPCNTR
ncbi:MAG TPA: pullulanase-type alpha-1,6-glucosidase [Haliangiales bacterium]|nr:pullulanase-type alpha-1,6-glucosidase [Haliangiales bacterium]